VGVLMRDLTKKTNNGREKNNQRKNEKRAIRKG
jgi:hypothetical protein